MNPNDINDPTRLSMEGQTALVTGASRGIGRAIAMAFAAAGARVLVHYVSSQKTAEELCRIMPGSGHAALRADLDGVDGAATLWERVRDCSDRIDVAVNNAGVYLRLPDPTQCTWDQWQENWDRTMGVNLNACGHVTLLAAQHMAARGGGRIINISSRGAFRGEPHAPAYGASKAAVNSLSQSLAQSFAPHGVLIFVIAPGFVETDMAAPFLRGERGDAIRAQSPLGRAGRPEEIAATALFLAAGDTAYMTGAVLDQNGASYLRT